MYKYIHMYIEDIHSSPVNVNIRLHIRIRVHVHMHTGWRRPIGCLKLQVIFRKRATNYRALLRNMTYKDKASYDSTPPCTREQYTCLRVHAHKFSYRKLGHMSMHIYF